MTATQTSIESYCRVLEEEKLHGKRLLLFKYISGHPGCTDRKMAQDLSFTINYTTGGRNALVRQGYVKADKLTYDEETDRNVMTWRLAI
jgi:hypothetical protein